MKVLQQSKAFVYQTNFDTAGYPMNHNTTGTWYKSHTDLGQTYSGKIMAPFIPPPEKKKIFAGIGSRETPEDICKEITKFSQIMRKKGWLLRSGGAEGADTAFEAGYSGYPDLTEIYLPWKKFNGHSSPLYAITEQALLLARTYHPNWDKCNDAARKLLARNGYQVFGNDLNTPADLIVCWTKDGQEKGGTSQAIRIAKASGIRVVNLGDIKV